MYGVRARPASISRIGTGLLQAVAVAAVLVASQASAADQPAPPAPAANATPLYEPTGFGTAKFGMSLAQVWKMYPQARLLRENETLGAAAVGGPYIDRLVLRNQPVPGFAKPTTVELRFWKDQLWGVIVFFGDNDPEQCKAYLAKTFGPTTSRDPDNPVWLGGKVSSTGTYKEHWYGYTDIAMSQEAGAWVKSVMNGTWKGETAEEKAAREKRMAALTPSAAHAAAGTPATTTH
jgi:hypothetical protein